MLSNLICIKACDFNVIVRHFLFSMFQSNDLSIFICFNLKKDFSGQNVDNVSRL